MHEKRISPRSLAFEVLGMMLSSRPGSRHFGRALNRDLEGPRAWTESTSDTQGRQLHSTLRSCRKRACETTLSHERRKKLSFGKGHGRSGLGQHGNMGCHLRLCSEEEVCHSGSSIQYLPPLLDLRAQLMLLFIAISVMGIVHNSLRQSSML